jgi:hypothetical protein
VILSTWNDECHVRQLLQCKRRGRFVLLTSYIYLISSLTCYRFACSYAIRKQSTCTVWHISFISYAANTGVIYGELEFKPHQAHLPQVWWWSKGITTGDSRKEQEEPPWNGTLDHSATSVVAQPLSHWKTLGLCCLHQ